MASTPSDLRFAILASDTAVLAVKGKELMVRLIRVDRPPHYPSMRGLVGGLVKPSETAEESAKRTVGEKSGIASEHLHFEQLYTFSAVDRDKRGRVVAVGYIALTAWEELSDAEQLDTDEAWWVPVQRARNLAYDHNDILSKALERLRSRVRYTTLMGKLMPKEFSLTELMDRYAVILGASLDKRNFRKKIQKLKVLKELPKKRTGAKSRPAQLFTFASNQVKDIEVL